VIIRMTAGNGKIMMTVMMCREEYRLWKVMIIIMILYISLELVMMMFR
jgi:hypothetical protein